jgi:hypothetical protein
MFPFDPDERTSDSAAFAGRGVLRGYKGYGNPPALVWLWNIAAEAAPAHKYQSGVGGSTGAIGALLQDALIDFLAVYLHFGWRFDSDTDLIPLYPQYGDRDVITDDKLFSNPSCQNKHNNLPLVSDTSCIRAFSLIFYALCQNQLRDD